MVVVCAVALLGVTVTFISRAAGTSASAVVAAGVIGPGATKMANATALGGYAVRFGPLSYVALGDSVASGEGINYGWVYQNGNWQQTGPSNPVWEPTTDLTPAVQDCHRSAQGYPALVAASTGYNVINLSCSGASVTAGVLGNIQFDSKTTGAAQLGTATAGFAPPNASYDAAKPQVVTITIGMDDVGFEDLLTTCYTQSCGSASDDQALDAKIATFQTNLETMLTEIKNRGTADGYVPWVVLTNYYDPFNDAQIKCGDIDLGFGFGLSATQITWLESKLQVLNQAIVAASATYPKAKIADISNVLAGHQLCSTDPWVYGPSIIYDDPNSPAPFHPTPSGQQAIASVVTGVIKTLSF